MQEKARLQALLPDNWQKDLRSFFNLDGETLMSLMAFCTASLVYGVQTRTMGHTARSPLCYQRCKTDPPQRLKIDPGVNLLL
ncbi:hypothetical protein RBG07_25710 [Klebsiella aerogenes]|nr:hypothetical protein [Klebsiella aerogenes]